MTVLDPLALTGAEQIVLDPDEVAEDRVELDLHSDSIWVREEGPDWGEAALQNFSAQLARGEVPVDVRYPNRTVTIPLVITETDPDLFAAAREDLQAKAGTFQTEGGNLKRELRSGAKLYLDVVGATLKYGGGTHQALHGLDPNVELTLECIPDWYGDEIELDDIVETTNPEIASVLKEDGVTAIIKGNYPGRVRIVVDEDDGDDQLGGIWAWRSRHYSSDADAAIAYQAEALTNYTGASDTALTGASGGNVVRHTDLGTSWTPVVGGNFEHTGTIRLWVRVHSTSGSAVEVRAVYDVGDLTNPVENSGWTFPAASQFFWADLGEIRIDPPPVGTHSWTLVIQAKGAVGGEDVDIDRLCFVHVDEGYGTLRAPIQVSDGLTAMSARDEFNQSAGNLSGKTAPIGGNWVGAGDADQFVVDATGHTVQRTAISDTPDTGRWATLDVNLASTIVQMDFEFTGATSKPFMGVVARYASTSAHLRAFVYPSIGIHWLQVTKRVGGVDTVLWSRGTSLAAAADHPLTFRLSVDAKGQWVVWVYHGVAGSPLAQGQDSALATAGTLASGDVGIYDENQVPTASTRTYDSFAAWVPPKDAIAFAGQSAQLTTEGMFREDAAGAHYGPISHAPGGLPRIPPSGLEDRPVELFLLLSRGDLDQVPDSGIDDKSAKVFYKPSFLFVPE